MRSLAADVAIAAAERAERSAGASAGLALFRTLASKAPNGDLRGRAILGALRCATTLRDEAAATDLARLWQTVDGVAADGIFVACKEAWRASLRGAALAIANAEAQRAPSARSLYLVARCLDVASDPRATAAFTEALGRAEREGAAGIAHASRVRRAAWLARRPETLGEAITEAQRASLAAASPAERLVLARILLRSPSRFVRTTAIASLDDLVSEAAPGSLAPSCKASVARSAVLLAARHADDAADRLTTLEVDRLLALFAREAIGKAGEVARTVVRAIDRLARTDQQDDVALDAALAEAAACDPDLAALHARARDILGGRFEPVPLTTAPALGATSEAFGSGWHALWSSLLDTAVALRDHAWPRAAHALERLRAVQGEGQRMPPSVWTVLESALLTTDAELQAAAARLVALLLVPSAPPPPRGWLGLSRALAAADRGDLAAVAQRAAAVAKEPGAASALALALTRAGWQLAEAGERSRAIASLREARALGES